MLIDWAIYGLLIWALAALLNATAFKEQPASKKTAWVATVAVFFVNLVAMTALQYLRYQAISDSLGFKVTPRSPLDVVSALTFAMVFFALLRKQPKVGKAKGDMTAACCSFAREVGAVASSSHGTGGRPARPLTRMPAQMAGTGTCGGWQPTASTCRESSYRTARTPRVVLAGITSSWFRSLT